MLSFINFISYSICSILFNNSSFLVYNYLYSFSKPAFLFSNYLCSNSLSFLSLSLYSSLFLDSFSIASTFSFYNYNSYSLSLIRLSLCLSSYSNYLLLSDEAFLLSNIESFSALSVCIFFSISNVRFNCLVSCFDFSNSFYNTLTLLFAAGEF